MEGDSVTLNTGVQTNQQDRIRQIYNDFHIAQINRDLSKIRGRLKLDHQTGSLTIRKTRNTDSGVYKLSISSGSDNREKVFSVSVTGDPGADREKVSGMEGDSVTLHTGVQTNQQDIIWWYNGIRIAQIIRDQSKTCTDVQCNEGTERFRDRLKLDHQTGSLTIMNTTDTDSGVYQLISRDSEKIFNVSVTGVSAAERDEVKRKSVKKGESVTLVSGLTKKTKKDSIKWYFNDILIAEITGNQSKICTAVQCKERFRDRLKLDHQTGSLNITNIRNTDSGEYKLQISNSRYSSLKTFSVTATGVSSAFIAGISVAAAAAVVLLLITVAVIYYRHRRSRKRKARQNGGG